MKKVLLVLCFFICFLFSVHSQIIKTIAGNGTSGFSGDGGQATAAEIYYPNRVAEDAAGNLYLSTGDNRIRKVSTTGIITTLAGTGTFGFSGDGGQATAAELNTPYGICVDKFGNIYIADQNNNKVRKINTSGIISTIAGTGIGAYTGNGGPATAATLHYPEGVAIDTTGNIFIADNGNYVIRKINTSGIISTVAGNGTGGYSGDGGQATAAELDAPADVTLDSKGNLFSSDSYNEVIRKVNTSGIISTYAGCGTAGSVGDGYPATSAGIDNPQGISADKAGNLYIADYYNSKIRKVNAFGIIYTAAGTGAPGFSGDGGPATAAEINYSKGVCVDAYNNIYIADNNNSRIRKISLPFSDTLTAVSSSNCASCNGSATGIVTGGYPPYSYLWAPGGATAATITGLCPGFYSLTVVDSQNDSLKNKTVLVRSAILSDSMGEICAGCCNCHGKAGVKVFGGTLPYTFLWSNGGTTDTISGISGGTYTVTVTDNSGCTLVDTVFVTRGLHISVTSTNVTCNGGNNGTATVSGPAGTSYIWQPGNLSGASVSGLSSGTYTVTATNPDSGGCSAVLTVTITQSEPLAVSLNSSGSCSLNGGWAAAVIGGTPPYTYHWSTGSTWSAIMILLDCYSFPPSFVSVMVTDHNGCTAGAGELVNVPFQVYGVTQTNVSCNGGNNGSITVTACGSSYYGNFTIVPGGTYYGNSPYTFSNLAPGTYTVYAYSPGCPMNYGYAVTITQPATLSVTATATANVSCNGGSNGSASSSVSGGTTAYTYSWSGGHGSNPTATGLSAGTYTLNVTDHNGCTGSASVTITQPTQIAPSICSVTNESCNGGNNGCASVCASGGVSPYTYNWSNGGTGTNQCSLTAGTYTATVTDSHGCIVTATATITQPAAVTANISTVNNASCYNSGTGSATVTAGGGTGVYTYSWNTIPLQTNATATGLTAGSYTVTVTDHNGCTATANTTITQPPSPLRDSITAQTDNSCFGGNAGALSVGATGGTGIYTYLWSPSAQTSPTAINLTAGCYTITVTDANGCVATASSCITQPSQIHDSITSQTNISCFGGSNGAISVGATGGGGTYTYMWSPGGMTSATITDLSVGCYTLTVNDVNGCSATAAYCITQPAQLTVPVCSITNVSCNGGNSGCLSACPGGGTGPYTYQWSPNGSTSNNNCGLSAGCYTLTVTDANGCQIIDSNCITQPTALTATVTATPNPMCQGSCSLLKVFVAGGSPAYTYAWSNGATTSATMVCPTTTRSYTVHVTDGGGCSLDSVINIIVFAAPIISLHAAQDTACSISNNDMLIGTPPGGTYSGQGVTANNFNPSSVGAGTYWVRYSYSDSNSCTSVDSIQVLVDVCVGTHEISSLENGIDVYPNPFSQTFTVDIKMEGPVKVEIYDVVGKEISSAMLDKGTHSLNMENYPKGVYFMQIKTPNGVLNRKLVKVD